MQQNFKKEKREKELEAFLNYRESLSDYEQRIEAGSLISKLDNVDTNKAFEQVNERINTHGKSVNFINYLTRIAAVLTIPLLAFAIWSLFFSDGGTVQQADLSYQELSSPAGMRSQVILPDGSVMWLNAQSSVKYSIPFTKRQRVIELKGEAFLNVVKNKKVPFIVKSAETSVEVLGTQFNVKAYPGDQNIQVALLEGKVRFHVDKENHSKFLELTPGDYIVYNKEDSQTSRTNTNVEKYIAWHNNVLVLDETPMEEVAVLLERWYGVKVIIQDEELKKYKFTTTFDNESLFRVLELLELSSPDIEIKYTPSKRNDNQSVVCIKLKK